MPDPSSTTTTTTTTTQQGQQPPSASQSAVASFVEGVHGIWHAIFGSRQGEGDTVYDPALNEYVSKHLPLWRENWTKLEMLGVLVATVIMLALVLVITVIIVSPVNCATLPRERKECLMYSVPSVVLADSEVMVIACMFMLTLGSYYRHTDRKLEQPRSITTQRVLVLTTLLVLTYSVIALTYVHAHVGVGFAVWHMIGFVWIWYLMT